MKRAPGRKAMFLLHPTSSARFLLAIRTANTWIPGQEGLKEELDIWFSAVSKICESKNLNPDDFTVEVGYSPLKS